VPVGSCQYLNYCPPSLTTSILIWLIMTETRHWSLPLKLVSPSVRPYVCLSVCLSVCQWRRFKFILRGEFLPSQGGGRSPRPESRWSSWGGGSEPRPRQLGGLGSAVSSPRGSGRSPGKFDIWCNFRPQNSLQKCLITCKLLQKCWNIEGAKRHYRPWFFIGGRSPPSPRMDATAVCWRAIRSLLVV